MGAWLTFPHATALEWRVDGIAWEEDVISGLEANKGLQRLRMEVDGVWVAPLLQALQGHARLEAVDITAIGDESEEDLSIRVAHMPSLRSFTLKDLSFNGGVRLELDGLPSLQALTVQQCGLYEVCYSDLLE